MSHIFTGHEVPAYHITGCNGVAFYFLYEPHEGMEMTPDKVVYADGTSPPSEYETRAICGSCSEDLAITDLTIRRPTEWQVPLPPSQ